MSAPAKFASFVTPGPGFFGVPTAVANCIMNSRLGSTTAECDAIVGSTTLQQGFCNDLTNRNSTFCACVNSLAPCPKNAGNPYCQQSPQAYIPSAFQEGSEIQKACNAETCVNVIGVSGSGSSAGGSIQSCGNVVEPPKYPIAYILLFVTIILLAIVLGFESEIQGLMRGQSALPASALPPTTLPASALPQ